MPAWCYFNNDMANAPLGKLYNWHSVRDPRGLAPKGWYIPRVMGKFKKRQNGMTQTRESPSFDSS